MQALSGSVVDRIIAFFVMEECTLYRGEFDSLVPPTLAPAQTVPTRAWLSVARRAVPGGPRAPTPRRVLTATRHFVPRCTSARRGRARLSALFRTVRTHHVPVAVSSGARHALPDPSRYPVHAADSQHTPECMARAAEYAASVRCVCRAAEPSRAATAARRAVPRRDAYSNYANYILFRRT